MTTTLVGGHNLGLLDSSATLLNRNERSSKGFLGQGEQPYANVSNGNLILQQRDVLLPSRGADFELVRTYNSRGYLNGPAKNWTLSTAVSLSSHQDKPANNGPTITNYTATYGDGSESHFSFSSGARWVSTDGAGAYETLDVLSTVAADGSKYVLTRANQTQFRFDKNFALLSNVDTNGVRMDYVYQGGKLQQVRDDTGHVITFNYSGLGNLTSITDQTGVTLVSYSYQQSNLASVTDRYGHVTSYSYDAQNGLLSKVSLPNVQTVNGQVQTFDVREMSFTYQSINWSDNPHVGTPFDQGFAYALKTVTDAMGGVTTFSYNFNFSTTALDASDRDIAFKQQGGRYFTGGRTDVIDALGRQLSYTYDADGYITSVIDQAGFKTTYTYDTKDNLTSVVDRNGWGATNSDSVYFRDLRKDLGCVDAVGNGKLVANLTAAEKTALLAKFTTSLTYDARGNLLSYTDNAGNATTYTYTAFNKLASETAAMGNALTTSNDVFYQQKRTELGYPALVASLTAAQKTALQSLYSTTYGYDAKQNLTQRIDAGGDVTNFEYDAFGNLTKRTVVYRDAGNVAVPAKNQVTTYGYDAFGNNTTMVDGEGFTTVRTFDHFGNMLTSIDGRGGVTTYTYDADNRLLSTTDPEGHVTVNAYDAVGNRISITDANGHTITQIFNKNNLLIATIDPAANAAASRTTTFTYDILGNQTEVLDAEGRKTTYAFNALRQLVTATTPQVLNGSEALVNYQTNYVYDGESNIVTHTDNNGNVTQALYTTNGLLKRQTDPIGNVTEFLYDANLQRVQITIGAQLAPALRRVLRFGYDEENQLTAETDALGGVTRHDYDAPGNVVSMVDANGNKTDYEYDRDNRLIKETRPQVTDPISGLPTRYTVLHQYDANDNKISTTDENGRVTTYAFDKDNRMVMVTDANGVKTVYGYDSRDNRTQIAMGVDAHLDVNGQAVIDGTSQAAVRTFAYDEFNQLTSVTDAVGNALATSDATLYQNLRTEQGFAALVANLSSADKAALRNRFTTRYGYDRVGNRVQLTDHLGRISSFNYDALDRLQQRIDALSTAEQRSTQLRYDGNGSLVKRTDSLGRVDRFTFDGNDRLVSEIDALGSVTRHDYDNVGSEIASTKAFGTAEARATTYVYDLNNRLTRETDPLGHFKTYQYDAVGNRLKVIDAKGGATQYVYDALHRNIKVIDPLNFQTRYEYDGVGNNITVIDANGGIQRMQYDGVNRYIQTTDPMGRVTRLAYDRLNNLVTQTTAFGLPEAEVTQFLYDAEGHLRQVTDAAGNISTDGFDAAYNRTRHTDGNGRTTTTEFDALNRQIKATDALGGVTTYRYDLEDNQLSATDPLGRQRSFQYDAKNRLIIETDALGTQTTYGYDTVDNQVRITRAANRGVEARTETFVYNKDDQLISQTDALGNTTIHAYDANHNLVSSTDALGRVTTYTYDANDRITLITDPLGHVTQYKYDGKGNRTQVIDPRGNKQTSYYNLDDEVILLVDGEGNAVARSYDGNGNLVATRQYMTPLAGVIDPAVLPVLPNSTSDRLTSFVYDKLNRLIRHTDALGGIAILTYDAVGNELSRTDENGNTVRYAYDALNRIIRQTDALNGARRITYDAVGNQLSKTDENGHTRSYIYDAEDRLISETDPLGGTRTYAYDAVHNLRSESDENGHITSFVYDLGDRLIKQVNPLLGMRQYAYDAVGNRTGTTDENGHVTGFAYDADNRLIGETDALGGVRTTTYDAADNVASMTDQNGHTVSYAYDKNNRLIAKTDAQGKTRQYVYDAADNLLRETDENAHATNFAYDANNRLITRTDALGKISSFSYDAVGNRLSRIDENGHQTRFQYDANDRLVKQIDPLLGERLFNYDAVGNRLGTTDENGHITRQIFDANDRLVKRIDPLLGEQVFTYDAVGNQLSATDENGHKTSNTYDANDRLVTRTDPLLGVKGYSYDAVGNQLSETDENGHTTSYVYDANDRLIKRTDPLAGFKTYAYDAAGNRQSVTDENGHTMSYVYDANDRMIRQVDALLGVKIYTYDAVGNQLSVTDENNHKIGYAFDANDRLIKQTDALLGERLFTYDAAGNRVGMTDENGHQTRYVFDANDRLIQQIDALLGERRYTYDAVGNRLSESDANGHVTSFLYDANDRQIKRIDPLLGEMTFSYDAVGNQLSATDENNHTTHFSYDANDRLLQKTDALAGVKTYTYDAVGNQLSVTDENGHKTSFLYDANNRLTKKTDPLLGVKSFTYDAVGNQLSMTDANGHTTSSLYDANDRLIKQTDALAGFKTFTYDAVGNQLSMTDENGRTTNNLYDANDRLIKQTDPLGNFKTFAYDAAGNRLSMTDENAHTTVYLYDANDRLIKQTDPLAGFKTFTYDAAGNRLSMTDEIGKTTRYDYDVLDRLIKQTDPLAGIESFSYDAVGNRLSMTDENGHTTSYVYDANNRLTKQTDPLAGFKTFTYDAVGNRSSATDENGHAHSFVYDANDRLVSVTDPLGGVKTYTYDGVGNQLSETDENGHTSTSVYDANDRLIRQTDPLLGVMRYTYDAVGNRSSMTDQNGRTTRYVFDGNDRLIQQTDALGGIKIFTYDGAGNRTSEKDENGHTTAFEYDANNRLTKQIDALLGVKTFSYDAVGNRLSVTDQNAHTTSFAFDANHRLVRQTDALGALRAYSYDAVGNQLSLTDENGNTTTAAYDANNRVTKQTDALGGFKTYTYDAVGNQLSMTDENGHTTQYLYDVNDRLSREIDPLGGVKVHTYDAVGNRLTTTDANAHKISYSYDANNRLVTRTNPLLGVSTMTYDAAGNQLSVTDENGRTTSNAYDALNRQISKTDPLGNVKTFTYDGVGNQLSMTDENGHITRYAYDANHRLIKQTDALLGVKTYAYDAVGNQLSMTDESGHTSTLAYDAKNRLITRADALGHTQHYAYDAFGNMTRLTDENGHATTFVFDGNHRLIRQTDASGHSQVYAYDAVGNRTRLTDENNHTTTFTYDANDRLTRQTNALGGFKTFTYDAVGNQLSLTDENGHRTDFLYDANDRITQQTNPLLGVKRYTYDAVGNELSVTDENDHKTSLAYDANNRLISQTDPLLGVKRYSYDAVGNQIGLTDANGHTTASAYDADNRLVTQTNALGQARHYGYDAVGNRTSLTDERGNISTSAYDASNRLMTQTDALGHSRQYTYDSAGNLASLTDENGHATTYAYDALDRLVTLTDALGHAQHYAYDANGQRISLTDENGHTTTYAYDANNRLIAQTDALSGNKSYTHDAVGNRLTVTDENGHTTQFLYDANDRLTRQTDALGGVKTFAYDAVGNQLNVIDEIGRETRYAYDANDRVIRQTNPLLGVKTFAYDAVGNRTRSTDENGHATTFAYDALNRITAETNALGHAQGYAYDATGNLTRRTDQNGHATTFAHDAVNRVVRQTNALGQSRTFEYDAAGNRTKLIDENGNAVLYAYDANDRQISWTDALGQVMLYSFDAVGNRLTQTDQNGHGTQYNYDANNRLVKVTDALGYQTNLRYDAVGNTLETSQQLSLSDLTQVAVIRSAYDANNRLVALLSAEGYLKTYAYDAAGQQTQLTEFDNKTVPTASGAAPLTATGPRRVTLASYDANGRKITETSALGFITRYDFDAAGNRTAKVEADGTPQARRTEIHYDAANRITDVVDALNFVTHTVRDAVGNALAVHEAFGIPAARVTTFEYDANNRVSRSIDALGVISELTYDAVGNMTQRRSAVGLAEERTERFEYDANRRQTAQINGEGERMVFSYDGVGNRTARVVAPGLPEQRVNRMRYDADNRLIGETDGNGVETQYEYDGAGNKIKTVQLAAVYDSNGNPITTYQGQAIAGQRRETLFTHDLDNRLVKVTDPMGGITRYVLDALGNRTQIIDANGTLTENTFDAGGHLLTNWVHGSNHGGVLVSNRYDAFGNIVQTRRGFQDGTDTRQTTYVYDRRDRTLSITEYDKVDSAAALFTQAFSTLVEYDAFGNQTKVSQGAYLLNPGDSGYDASKAARAQPLVASFAYDEHDKLVAATDGVTNTIAYTNDAHGMRTSQTTGAGTTDARTVSFAYDRADRTIRQETGAGGLIKLGYDQAGNQVRRDTLQSGSEAAGLWVTEIYGYDGNGRIISTTDSLGVVATNILDAFGNQIERHQAAGSTDERVVKSEYNPNNDLVAVIDALGNRTAYEVDKLGNRISQTDAQGHVTHLYYNELNKQIGTLDPEGYFTRIARDSAGHVLQTQVYLQRYAAPLDGTPPLPSAADLPRTTTNEYDGAGDLIRKTEPDQRVKDFVFDSAHKLLQVTDHGSGDAAAQARTYDKSARVQTFSYDAAGRLARFTNVDGVIETYAYDTANNIISESITNPNALASGRADPVRTTVFEFDAANRQTKQIFDPIGIAQVQTLSYDKAGNVIGKTDALGHTTTMTYDLANRMLSITDALAHVSRFTYDRVGNRLSAEDARGQVTNFEYDLNNRVVKEIHPAVDVFTVDGGLQSNVRPTKQLVYDSVGNEVQTVDPSGNKTTRYYDGNHQLIAELNGDNALREFSVDAVGARTSTTLYMTRLPASAHDPSARPVAPSGEQRTITAEYDAMSRLVRTTYPAVDITALSGTNTDNPSASVAHVSPEQRHFYDAFGNLVESVNLAGNHTFAYFDKRDRVVATVDAAGYLIESDFDDQGNLVQQRKYEQALSGVSAGVKPNAGASPIAVVDRYYDAASRLLEEISPEAQLDAGVRERVSTRFTYDAAGNQLSKTLAANTADASTEYTYYDADGRRVALVNSARTLHVFGYDANGNQTSLRRYITPVPGNIDLATADLTQVLAAVVAAPGADEETRFTYDALNRQTAKIDLMGLGSADDIVIGTRYDALGNVTSRTDAEGFTTRVAYDALNHAIQTIAPTGSSSFAAYDAAGLKIRTWTGDLGSVQAQPATNVTASVAGDLRISWTALSGSVQSYVVYDTVAHDAPAQYANQSALQGGGEGAIDIALASLVAGTTLFFRVVTVDAAGSIAWTEEKQLTVPARLTAIEVTASDSAVVISARFDGAITNPVLKFGVAGSSPTNQINFVLQADGSYRASIANPTNSGQGLAYEVQWDFNGQTFTTNAIAVATAGEHTAVDQTLTWPVPAGANGTDDPNGQFVIVNGVRVDAFQVNGALQFDPKLTAAGTYTYHVYYGDLEATQHSLDVSFEDHQSTFVLSDTGPASARTLVLRWKHDEYHTHVKATLSAAEAAKVGGGGVHAQIKAASATDAFTTDIALPNAGAGVFAGDFNNLAAGSYDLQVYYLDASGRKVIVEWTRITVPAQPALPADATVVDNTDPFVFDGQAVSSGGVTDNTFPFNLERAVAAGAAVNLTGHSVTVFGTERNGSITRAPNGSLSVTPGVYSGAVDLSEVSYGVASSATASAGPGSAKLNGLTAGTYFTEYEYNALGRVIATNEGSGLWRRFGVDAQGNAVQTKVYGTRADEVAGSTPIITYAAFDSRNLKVAEFGAATPVAGLGGLHRAVTRGTFDYAGQLLSRQDPTPGAQAVDFSYDAAGNKISETDALGNVTIMVYDRRGNEVRRTDALGRVRRKRYDVADRLVQEIDPLGQATQYAYDAFGRQTQITDALGHQRASDYDQHDRLVQVTDALGHVTRYTYDKRDNRIWTEDANHHFSGLAYDALGHVTHTYSFQEVTPPPFSFLFPMPATLADAIDAVNNPNSLYRSRLVDESSAYDAYGNKIVETDAQNRSRFFTYGAFGRLLLQSDEGRRVTTYFYDRFGRLTQEARPKDASVNAAKNITRSYDDAGRVTQISDIGTGMTTTYGYDVAGHRKTERIVAPNFSGSVTTARNISYSYDGSGRMLSWSDSVTGKNLSYEFDANGNQTRVFGSNGVDHHYTYDANDHVTQILQGTSTLIAAYGYDALGRRSTYNDGSNTASYSYDANDRVVRADTTPNATPGNTSDDSHAIWQYDNVGNVTLYKELAADNTTVKYARASIFAANNRTILVATDDQRDPDHKSKLSTANTLDKTGRVLVETQTNSTNPDDVKTTTYTHKYSADGRELSITATGTGDVTGSTRSTFDANDHLIKVDLGQGDGLDSAEFKRFIHNSDGQILSRFYDDGVNGNTNPTTQFLYANGNPVGQTGNKTDGTSETLLDTQQYTPLQNLGADLPSTSVTSYVVQAGDTLQSIAARVYANPSLWFVIAQANGLSGSETLPAGTRLSIPNNIEAGRNTAETHNVYRESQIVGSTLPNLKSPPPSICAIIGAIILAIIIAIVAVIITIATAGIGAEIGAALIAGELPATAAIIAGASAGLAGAGAVIGAETVSAATLAAGLIGGVIGGLVGGVVVGFAASALTQGVQIAFGLQRQFDWKQLGADVAGFALGGIGGALSAGAEVAARVAALTVNSVRIARVAAASANVALAVGGEAISQASTHDGRIEQPWMLGVVGGAVIGAEVIGALASRAFRSEQQAQNTVDGALTDTGQQAASGQKLIRISNGSEDSVGAKSVNELGSTNTGVPIAAKIKAVDNELTDLGNGQSSLKVKNASDSVKANDSTSSFTWTSSEDPIIFAGHPVKSQNPLDMPGDLKIDMAHRKLISGEASDFDEKTVVDFAQGSVGKVKDNTVPIDELSMVKPVDAKQNSTGDALVNQMQQDGKIAQPDDAVPVKEVLDSGPKPLDVENILQELVSKNTGSPNLPATRLPDYTSIPDRYFLPKTVRDARLPKGVKHVIAENFGSSQQKAQQRIERDFVSVYDYKTVDGTQRLAQTDAFLQARITGFKTGFSIKSDGKDIPIPANPELAQTLEKANPRALAALYGYSEKDTTHNAKAATLGYYGDIAKYNLGDFFVDKGPAPNLELKNKFGKNYHHRPASSPDKSGVPDYAYLNAVTRGFTDDKEAVKGFDGYIRLAVQGLHEFEPHRGTVFRGGQYDEQLANKLFKEGDTYTEKAFLSTTRRPESAFDGNTVFVINSRGGARKVEGVSGVPHEMEATFAPGTHFKVLKVDNFEPRENVLFKGDTARSRIVYLDEIRPSGPANVRSSATPQTSAAVRTEPLIAQPNAGALPQLTAAPKQGLTRTPSGLSQDASTIPLPVLQGAVTKIGAQSSPLSQDAVRIPLQTRLVRARAQTERSLAEPSVTMRAKVAQSNVSERLDPEFKTSSVASQKSLKEYFELGMTSQTQTGSATGRRLQLLEMHGHLSKDLPNQQRELTRLQNQLQKALARKDLSNVDVLNKNQLSDVLSNEQQLKSLSKALSRQGLPKEAMLTDAVLAQHLRLNQLRQEQTLLRDTVNDPALINSAYISSPAHAIELKRLGLQPSAAGRVGDFTDVRLQGDMKKLGSGNFNTVFVGKYTLPDKKGSYEGVFKAEVRGDVLPDVANAIGVTSADVRAGYRNVATTRLDELLGLGGLTTRSEMAIHNHTLGTVSERAAGVSPKGPTVLGKDSADEIVRSYMNAAKVPEDRVVAAYNAEGGKQVGVSDVDGQKKYFFQDESLHDINYSDPLLRRDLVRLQLMDSISGQVDRHVGNYFVKQSAEGKVLGIKGIDNDLSWGQKLTNLNDQSMASHLPSHLPPVVDRQAFDSIMSLNQHTFKHKMGGLLTSAEINAANDRLLQVQSHLRTLERDGHVLNRLDDWSSPNVSQLLLAEKNNKYTNYIARDFGLKEYKQGQGLVIPYPIDKTT